MAPPQSGQQAGGQTGGQSGAPSGAQTGGQGGQAWQSSDKSSTKSVDNNGVSHSSTTYYVPTASSSTFYVNTSASPISESPISASPIPASTASASTTSSSTTSAIGRDDVSQIPIPTGPSYSAPGSGPREIIFRPWLMAAIVLVVLFFLAGSLSAFLVMRARRRRDATPAGIPEMRDLALGQGRNSRAYIRPPSSEPPSSATQRSNSDATTPVSDTPPTQRQSQPVILSTTMDQAYYTGLDTADQVSLSDTRSQECADIYDGDEPPPPYRPRSVPPISRDASVRTSNTARTPSNARRNQNNDQSTSHLIGGMPRSQDLRSPFEDPDEDDAASETSEVTVRPHCQAHDRLSVVSDLSYQHEPVQGRSSL